MGLLSVKESIQHAVITGFLEGHLSISEACQRLDLHRSTFWRRCQRYKTQGPMGLAHRLRGQTSNFSKEPPIKEAILRLFANEFAPFGFRVAHFYQDASPSFPQPVSYPTVLRWLKSARLVQRVRKGVKHHSRRPRRASFGELIQMDTSTHDWLSLGHKMALVANIDDATNFICGAHLCAQDTTLGNFTVLKQTIASYGLFASLYVDRSPIFKVTRTPHSPIQRRFYESAFTTQVERALDELGIELIYAYSPQAKGRVERGFGTWQNRLIPELRKNGIKEPHLANQYIREVYVPKHNERFAQNPKNYPSSFVKVPQLKLDDVLCEKHRFTVSNDHVIRSKSANLSLKVLPSKNRLSFAKAKVDVRKHTDGSVSVWYGKQKLNVLQMP